MRCFQRKLCSAQRPGDRNRKTFRCAVVICAMACTPAMAYEPARARAGMAQEAAECAAYLMTAWQVPGADAGTKERLHRDAESLIELSGKLTSEKLARTRARLASRAMLLEIGNDSGKYFMLENKYQYSCKAIVSDPSARMQYWSNKQD